MSDSPKYTEREMVEAKRSAFVAGSVWRYFDGEATEGAEARRRYPLPRKTRPRVVTDRLGNDWRVADGQIQVRVGRSVRAEFRCADLITPEFAKELADLVTRPTEEYDGEDDE